MCGPGASAAVIVVGERGGAGLRALAGVVRSRLYHGPCSAGASHGRGAGGLPHVAVRVRYRCEGPCTVARPARSSLSRSMCAVFFFSLTDLIIDSPKRGRGSALKSFMVPCAEY